MPTKPYTCIRCNYQTMLKTDMYRHLFCKKRVCPTTQNDIELSDEIKRHILENRIYHIPKVPEHKIINQTINNYNTMNNFLNGIEPMTRLNEYLKYTNTNLIPFERTIELKYEKQRLRLDAGKGFHSYSHDDLFEIIDELTSIDSRKIDEFNLYCDSKTDKLTILESGEWKAMIISSGLKKVITIIQDYYWNTYEKYLIRVIQKTPIAYEKQRHTELLEDYYSFLAALDVDPCVKDIPNNRILYTDENEAYWDDPEPNSCDGFSLSERYSKVYRTVRDNLTLRQRDKIKNDLKDLLKRNSQRNAIELNKVLLSLIKVDNDFKQEILQLTCGSV